MPPREFSAAVGAAIVFGLIGIDLTLLGYKVFD